MDYFENYWYVTHYVDIYYKCDERKRHIKKCVVEYVVYKTQNNCFSFVVKCDYMREFYKYQNMVAETVSRLYIKHCIGYRYVLKLFGSRTSGIDYSND